MARTITVAAAQLGPIQQAEPRAEAVGRMIRLMERAHCRGVELVVFPELALTTFFPRHYLEDRAEADGWFETALPSNERPLRSSRQQGASTSPSISATPRRPPTAAISTLPFSSPAWARSC